jgi:hypothetical protein
MLRRGLLAAVLISGGGLSATQAAAEEPTHRIGFLGIAPALEGIQAWVEELRQRGYTNGQNLQIDCRYYFWVERSDCPTRRRDRRA